MLVTGAGGYLGSRIVATLRARAVPVIGTDRRRELACDLTDSGAVMKLLRDSGATTVVHCAAKVPRSDAGYDDETAARANLDMVVNLVSARPRHVVFTSTMAVYDGRVPLPVSETHEACGEGAYAKAKKAAETRLLTASGLAVTILRLPGLFGAPRRDGLLYNAALAFATGQVPRTPLDPPLWAAMHVADAAELCVRAALRKGPSIVVNAGYPGRFSIASAISDLSALFGVPAPACAPGPEFELDLTVLRRELGPLAHDFSSRLAELAAWARTDANPGEGRRRDA